MRCRTGNPTHTLTAMAHPRRSTIHRRAHVCGLYSSTKRDQMAHGHLHQRLSSWRSLLFFQGQSTLLCLTNLSDTRARRQLFRIYLHNSTSEDYETAKKSLTVFCTGFITYARSRAELDESLYSCSITPALALHHSSKRAALSQLWPRFEIPQCVQHELLSVITDTSSSRYAQ